MLVDLKNEILYKIKCVVNNTEIIIDSKSSNIIEISEININILVYHLDDVISKNRKTYNILVDLSYSISIEMPKQNLSIYIRDNQKKCRFEYGELNYIYFDISCLEQMQNKIYFIDCPETVIKYFVMYRKKDKKPRFFDFLMYNIFVVFPWALLFIFVRFVLTLSNIYIPWYMIFVVCIVGVLINIFLEKFSEKLWDLIIKRARKTSNSKSIIVNLLKNVKNEREKFGEYINSTYLTNLLSK